MQLYRVAHFDLDTKRCTCGERFEDEEREGIEDREMGEKGKVKVTEEIVNLSGKQILLFLLEFMAVSVVFLGLWYYIGEFYQGAIFFVARHILSALGYTPVQIAAVNLAGVYLVNFNLVPLVALAIATPKVALRRRLELLAIGIPILFLLHVLDTIAHLPYFIELHYMHRVGFATLVDSLGVIGLAMVFIIGFAFFFRKETCTKET